MTLFGAVPVSCVRLSLSRKRSLDAGPKVHGSVTTAFVVEAQRICKQWEGEIVDFCFRYAFVSQVSLELEDKTLGVDKSRHEER